MVRVPTDHEYGLWKVALDSQTADNVKATYVRPAPASIANPKKVKPITESTLTFLDMQHTSMQINQVIQLKA